MKETALLDTITESVPGSCWFDFLIYLPLFPIYASHFFWDFSKNISSVFGNDLCRNGGEPRVVQPRKLTFRFMIQKGVVPDPDNVSKHCS